MKKSRRHPNYTHKTPYTHVYSSSTDLEGTNPYKIPSCATSTFREPEGLQKTQTPVIPRNYTHETYKVSWEEHTARVFSHRRPRTYMPQSPATPIFCTSLYMSSKWVIDVIYLCQFWYKECQHFPTQPRIENAHYSLHLLVHPHKAFWTETTIANFMPLSNLNND